MTTSIRISMSDPSFGPTKTPDFPWVRFDSGGVIYEEALIEGQYLGAHWSAMGRPGSRQRVWDALAGRPESHYPLRQRQHAFQLQTDGQLLVDHWEWVEGAELSAGGGPGREAVVTLRHALRPVRVEVHTLLDGSPVLTRWLVIYNTGDRPAAVGLADPWSGLLFHRPDDYSHPIHVEPVFLVGRYRHVEWAHEGEFDFEPVPPGGLVMESRTGSSGYRPPFFIVRNQATGEAFVGALAYSGNWRLELLCDDTLKKTGGRQALLYFRFGLAGPAPLRVLAPGESAVTPPVHLGMCYGDLDRIVQGWHAHLRQSVVPKQPSGRCHLVECNHTGYTQNAQITEDGFLAEVETAAALGVELFLVDAGWFGDASGNWWTLVGDWQESELLPRGLKPIFDHARELGMATGLWVEAERAAVTSKTGRAHPDWFMRRRGLPIYALDLARPEVARHVEDTIGRLVETFQLDVFRLDRNIAVGDGAQAVHDGYAESTMWRYFESLWRIFENLRRRFPHLLLENCSGGGGRNDLGMLSRFHWTQLSDNWSPGPALKILNGMTLYLAPEQCVTLMGAISYGVSDLDFLLRIGLFNHFCVSGAFPSMALKNDWALERWRYYVDMFKRWVRPMLDTCRVFHHTPFQRHDRAADWIVLEYAAQDGGRAYAGIWRLDQPGPDEYRLLPRGLDRERTYRVRFDNSGQAVELSGHDLMTTGLTLRVPGPMTSELLLFEAC